MLESEFWATISVFRWIQEKHYCSQKKPVLIRLFKNVCVFGQYMKGWWFQMTHLLRGYFSRVSCLLCDGSIHPVHYRTVVKTSGSPPAHWSHLPSPPPLPLPLLRSVSSSLTHSLACFHSLPAPAGLGGSGARVAVATCPSPITLTGSPSWLRSQHKTRTPTPQSHQYVSSLFYTPSSSVCDCFSKSSRGQQNLVGFPIMPPVIARQ